MKNYPELHAKMAEDKERSTTQAGRLDELLARHDAKKSLGKEAVIGFKAYEISSYKMLLTLADAAGAEADKSVLEQSMKEEQEMGDWLGTHLPDVVRSYVHQQAA